MRIKAPLPRSSIEGQSYFKAKVHKTRDITLMGFLRACADGKAHDDRSDMYKNGVQASVYTLILFLAQEGDVC